MAGAEHVHKGVGGFAPVRAGAARRRPAAALELPLPAHGKVLIDSFGELVREIAPDRRGAGLDEARRAR
jgi:hypothetical protein